MSVNFTANFITHAKINQLTENGDYKPIDVSLTELDTNDANDTDTLDEIVHDWNKRNGCLLSSFQRYFLRRKSLDDEKWHFYALTNQKSNYEKLEPNSVLGLMLFMEKEYSDNEIALLETNPSYVHKKDKKGEYNHIGKALCKYVKNKYNNNNIEVFARRSALGFYYKEGFVQVDDSNDLKLVWLA